MTHESSSVQLLLKSLDKKYKDVVRTSDEASIVTLGRSRETLISDKRCSKTQLELRCDFKKRSVQIIQVGANPSAVDGEVLRAGSIVRGVQGSVIEVLAGEYKYKLEFDPPALSSDKKEVDVPAPADKFSRSGNDKKSSPSGNKRKGDTKEEASGESKESEVSDAAMPSAKRAKTGGGGWSSHEGGELLVYDCGDTKPASKIAAYDMDGTLITTKSGKVFPQNYDDWKLLYSEVPGKLKSMISEGYKVVLFTNQAGIGRGKDKPGAITGKISAVLGRLGVAAQVLVATGRSGHRKPGVAMWAWFVDRCNGGVAVQLGSSVYVGDAAGRPELPKQRKKDHSAADRRFALNVGLPFMTPEEHFLGRKAVPYPADTFDPRALDTTLPLYDPPGTEVPGKGLEVIVAVGYPGSGKSHFCSRVLAAQGYAVVNRDTLGGWQRCVAALSQALKSGRSVAVDNTNPDAAARARFVAAAKAQGAAVRCFVMAACKEHAQHNNRFRELTDSTHEKVTDMVFNIYKSKFKQPEKSEGFSEIVKVNFIPEFDNEEHKKLYSMFLLEK